VTGLCSLKRGEGEQGRDYVRSYGRSTVVPTIPTRPPRGPSYTSPNFANAYLAKNTIQSRM